MFKGIQKYSFSIIIVSIVISILGLFFIPELNIKSLPNVHKNELSILVTWDGATPEMVEKEVTSKLENSLSRLGSIEQINSTSSNGKAIVDIILKKGIDNESFKLEVITAIRQVYQNFPFGASYPQLSGLNFTSESTSDQIIICLSGRYTRDRLTNIADDVIVRQLYRSFSNISVSIKGRSEKVLEVKYDLDRVLLLGISATEIKTSIEDYLRSLPVSTPYLVSDNKRINKLVIKFDQNILDLSNITIAKKGNKIFYLKDLCELRVVESEPSTIYRRNGVNAVLVKVAFDKVTNRLLAANEVRSVISSIDKSILEPCNLEIINDSTINLKSEINNIFYRIAVSISVLLIIVFLVTRSLNYLLIIVLSLFFNVSIAFAFYKVFNVSIHMFSIAGLTISLGMLIDNSLIMIDHIYRFRNKKVVVPLLASTLTTIASVMIVYLLPEDLKISLIDFALVIVINLSISLLLSLWFIPSLLHYLSLKNYSPRLSLDFKFNGIFKAYIFLLNLFKAHRKLVIIITFLLFGIPVFMLPNSIEGDSKSSQIYNEVVGSNFYQLDAKKYLDRFLGGSLRLFIHYVDKSYKHEIDDETVLILDVRNSQSISIKDIDNKFMEIESNLSREKGVRDFLTEVNNSVSRLSIFFDDSLQSNSLYPNLVKNKLISLCSEIGGVEVNIHGIGQGYSSSNGSGEIVNYSMLLEGYDLTKIIQLSEEIKNKLLSNSRVRNVVTDGAITRFDRYKNNEYFFVPRAEQFSLVDADFNKTIEFINHFNSNQLIGGYYDKNELQKVFLKSNLKSRKNLWSLMNDRTLNNDYSLENVFSLENRISNPTLYKKNQSFLKKIKYKYLGNAIDGDSFLETVAIELSAKLPMGYKVDPELYNYAGEKTRSFYFLLPIIIIIIYIITTILFESLKQPFIVISLIPIAYIGTFLAYYIFDIRFDSGGYAAFVLVTGLSVNSSIYLIESYNYFKNRQTNCDSLGTCYSQAFKSKIFPVSLTILSTIFGLLPFAITLNFQAFWTSFAIGSIGGLLFSLVSIYVYLPILLLPKNEKIYGV